MESRIGHLGVETIAAESQKFTAPMLCVHGLWCTAAVWRRFMGFSAHRGWTCIAVNLRGRGSAAAPRIGRVRFTDFLDDLWAALAACTAPPVVVGHDLGALLALQCDAPAARAVVGVAPLLPGAPNRALTAWRARLAMWRRAPLPPPRRAIAAAYLGGARMTPVPDSSTAARDACAGRVVLPPAARLPTLMIAGGGDPFSPPAAVEQLAQRMGADFRIVQAAGHAMPWDTGWERCVAEVHRWLVRTLGQPLLLEREGEDE
jgi:pimeloyl-ACP methyl ester carboxylesterase